ncbi:DrmB family protein [Micromonospora chersina]|uniref:DrmB family protein n=1 Tax=Micromonospora chersina TaxID=47854 RepID=UPI003D94804B
MIAIDEASYIVLGLDSWRINDREETSEPRLQRALRIDKLYLPPAESEDYGAALKRFPEFYTCQDCRLLQPYGRFGGRGSTCACGGSLIPSRFVLACDDGHLEDFPYRKWVHRGSPDGAVSCMRDLKMVTTGRTASLRSIQIECGCGRKASMEGAFRRSELRRLGIRCSGARPWLRDAAKVDCARPPRTLQRGSSAAWFGMVRSSLAIPPWSEKVQTAIDRYYTMWRTSSDDVIAQQAEAVGILKRGITGKQVVDAVRKRARFEEEGTTAEPGDLDAELRAEEYEQLCTGTSGDEEYDDFECRPVEGAPPMPQIGQVMKVTRLREVRVLQSFTRVEPPSAADAATRHASLTVGDPEWLPAMEVIGEGVFLRTSEPLLREWEQREAVVDRAGLLIANHAALLRRRAEAAGRPTPPTRLTARAILLHTLAHVLINEWSLDSGYSASAMRERLYTDGETAGLLIYTATSDSAGSLGGIVRQADPDRLARTLRSALRRAQWCSADPLCMESETGGADSLNLAACHVCSLLPETSCEHNNTLLDRGLLIGWPTHPDDGFFSVR